jgi:hypothetical protein
MEIPARHEEHSDLCWFGPPESKTLRPVSWWNYARVICPRGGSQRCPLEGRPKPPYIGWRALGYKPVSIYLSRLQQGKLIRAGLSCIVLQAVFMSLGPHVRSGRAHWHVGGSSSRLGTTETLVGGDPEVPMSLKGVLEHFAMSRCIIISIKTTYNTIWNGQRRI